MTLSDIKEHKETMSLVDKATSAQLETSTSVTTMFRDVRVKDELEKKAFDALNRRLTPQTKMCRACKGEGYKTNGEDCAVCQTHGFVQEDADMRTIELVLAPKFPKTQININADLDGMTTESLLKLCEGI